MSLNLIFTQPGAYTIDDDGILGNNTSVIRDAAGVVIFTFVHPADALGFTVNVPGVTLTINILDSLGAADVTFGNPADASSPGNNLRRRPEAGVLARGSLPGAAHIIQSSPRWTGCPSGPSASIQAPVRAG